MMAEEISPDTYGNAGVVRHIIQSSGWKNLRRVVVVTSHYHAKRAELIFRQVLPLSLAYVLIASL